MNEACETVEEMDACIDKLATSLAANGPSALTHCKRILSDVAGVPWDRVEDITTKKISELRVSPEGQEGLKAFLEKRKPNWITE